MIKCIAASLIASFISTIAFGQNLPDSHYGPGPTLSGSSPVFTGLTLSGLTQGSVLFAGAGGVLSQDNANLFWDSVNLRLGIGTNAPAFPLQINSSVSNTHLRLNNTTAVSTANIVALDLALATSVQVRTAALLQAVFSNTTDATRTSRLDFQTTSNGVLSPNLSLQGTNLGIGTIQPQALLHVGTTAATVRSYNSFTDASNGEWAYMGDWGVTSNVATYGTNKNGTGSTRNLQFVVGGGLIADYGGSIAGQWNIFSTNNNSAIRVNSGGNSGGAGGGINFGINTFPTYSPIAQINGSLIGSTGTELQGNLSISVRPTGSAGQSLTQIMVVTGTGIVLPIMPTADPHVVGQLWNSSGTVHISAG